MSILGKSDTDYVPDQPRQFNMDNLKDINRKRNIQFKEYNAANN